METGFVFFTAIVLAVALAAFFNHNPMQVAGQPGGNMAGKIDSYFASPGLNTGPGIPAREPK